jgi:hypothetical protein
MYEDDRGERHSYLGGDRSKRWQRRFFEAAGVDPSAPFPIAPDEIPQDLHTPLAQWLERHGLLEDVPPELLSTWTGFGYGYLSADLPVWYVLHCSRVVHYDTLLPVFIADGNERLWDGVAGAVRERGGQVRHGAPVTRLDRSPSGVSLTIKGEAPRDFDAVVLAVPPHAAAALLPEGEREPFLRFRHSDYRVAAFETDAFPDELRSLDFIEPQRAAPPGAVMAVARTHQHRSLFIASQYGTRPGEAPLSDADLDERLVSELTRRGLPPRRVLPGTRWRNYFPHLSPEDLGRGTLREIEQRQGQNRTFYVGSYLSFETIEHTTRYAQFIMRSFFPRSIDER